MPDFTGKIGFITGAASAFARAGVERLFLVDKSETVETIARELKSQASHEAFEAHGVVGDVSDSSFVQALIHKRTGHLDFVVNCAGIGSGGRATTDMTIEQFDNINNVNYRGLWVCQQAAIKKMMEQDTSPHSEGSPEERERRGQRGAIVNVASQLGIVGRPNACKVFLLVADKLCTASADQMIAAYSASKAAVLALTRGDAIDYSAHRIRINAVCPGYIDTPLTAGESAVNPILAQPAWEVAPMKRKGLPSEIADAILWLCSTDASFVQGSGLVVDGGYTII